MMNWMTSAKKRIVKSKPRKSEQRMSAWTKLSHPQNQSSQSITNIKKDTDEKDDRVSNDGMENIFGTIFCSFCNLFSKIVQRVINETCLETNKGTSSFPGRKKTTEAKNKFSRAPRKARINGIL